MAVRTQSRYPTGRPLLVRCLPQRIQQARQVSFNDMLGTILFGEAPPFSRAFPLILLFLRLSSIQVTL